MQRVVLSGKHSNHVAQYHSSPQHAGELRHHAMQCACFAMPATDPALVLPAATEHSLSAQLSTIPLSADTPAMRCPVLTNRMLELSVLRSCLPRAYAGSTRPITLCFRCAMSDTHTAYAASPSSSFLAQSIPSQVSSAICLCNPWYCHISWRY